MDEIPNVSDIGSPDIRDLSPETFNHEAVIGRTSTTVVHKITVGEINNPIAIKHPGTSTVSRATFNSFSYEGQQWSQLADHPHIVGIVDWGENQLSWLSHDAAVPWVAMEYMDGGDLRENFEQFSVQEKYWIAEQIADAIWYAHHAGGGLTHRDLKPENILFRETPRDSYNVPKIGDWELTQTILNSSDNIGITTPQYSAPEQKTETVTNQYTDQFQLGIVFYELFTGVHPFVNDLETASEKEVMTNILQYEPIPPSEQLDLLSPKLDDIIMRMLSKDPEDRFEAMIQLRDKLNSLQSQKRCSEDQSKGFKLADGKEGTNWQREVENLQREIESNRADEMIDEVNELTEALRDCGMGSDEEIGYIERVEVLGESCGKEVLAKSDPGLSPSEIDSGLANEINVPISKEETENLGSSTQIVKYGTVEILINNNVHEVNVRIVDRSHKEYPVTLGRDITTKYSIDVLQRADEE